MCSHGDPCLFISLLASVTSYSIVMSNNSSAAVVDSWSNLPLYLVYVIQGLTISLGNILIMSAIIRYEALRNTKEYIIVLGLSLADTVNMAGYFFAGVYRTGLILSNSHESQESVWACTTTIQNLLWSLGVNQAPMMLAVVSIDRLVCVCYPLSYIGWSVSYARSLVSVAYLIGFFTSLIIIRSAYVSMAMVQATCVPPAIVRATAPSAFAWYYSYSPQIYAVLSVVIYVFVAIIYHRSSLITAPTDHPNQQYELKRQRKVTITLAICAFCTLFLFVLPYSIASFAYPRGFYTLSVACWCTANLNPFVNVFIYPLRQKEMKKAIYALLRCKTMPPDLKNWTVHVVSAAQEVHLPLYEQPTPHLIPRGAVPLTDRRAAAPAVSRAPSSM